MICLGAYLSEADAISALASRPEPVNELSIAADGDPDAPWRIWWLRA